MSIDRENLLARVASPAFGLLAARAGIGCAMVARFSRNRFGRLAYCALAAELAAHCAAQTPQSEGEGAMGKGQAARGAGQNDAARAATAGDLVISNEASAINAMGVDGDGANGSASKQAGKRQKGFEREKRSK